MRIPRAYPYHTTTISLLSELGFMGLMGGLGGKISLRYSAGITVDFARTLFGLAKGIERRT